MAKVLETSPDGLPCLVVRRGGCGLDEREERERGGVETKTQRRRRRGKGKVSAGKVGEADAGCQGCARRNGG